jgi:hypothetical protein
MWTYLFFISLKYLFPFIFYLRGGKTYQPALAHYHISRDTEFLQHVSAHVHHLQGEHSAHF